MAYVVSAKISFGRFDRSRNFQNPNEGLGKSPLPVVDMTKMTSGSLMSCDWQNRRCEIVEIVASKRN